MKSTSNGTLNVIDDAYIKIPLPNSGYRTIYFRSLPEISDSKQAVYNNEVVIGRSIPFYTYSHSGDRQIHIQLHFYVTDKVDMERNLKDLRVLQSAVYPRQGPQGVPYAPPPICLLRFKNLLAKSDSLCAILQSYSVKYPTDVVFDEITGCPYKFDVDTNWLSVYTSNDLPYQDRIITSGR
jgi:hypothetical protein